MLGYTARRADLDRYLAARKSVTATWSRISRSCCIASIFSLRLRRPVNHSRRLCEALMTASILGQSCRSPAASFSASDRASARWLHFWYPYRSYTRCRRHSSGLVQPPPWISCHVRPNFLEAMTIAKAIPVKSIAHSFIYLYTDLWHAPGVGDTRFYQHKHIHCYP